MKYLYLSLAFSFLLLPSISFAAPKDGTGICKVTIDGSWTYQKNEMTTDVRDNAPRKDTLMTATVKADKDTCFDDILITWANNTHTKHIKPGETAVIKDIGKTGILYDLRSSGGADTHKSADDLTDPDRTSIYTNETISAQDVCGFGATAVVQRCDYGPGYPGCTNLKPLTYTPTPDEGTSNDRPTKISDITGEPKITVNPEFAKKLNRDMSVPVSIFDTIDVSIPVRTCKYQPVDFVNLGITVNHKDFLSRQNEFTIKGHIDNNFVFTIYAQPYEGWGGYYKGQPDWDSAYKMQKLEVPLSLTVFDRNNDRKDFPIKLYTAGPFGGAGQRKIVFRLDDKYANKYTLELIQKTAISLIESQPFKKHEGDFSFWVDIGPGEKPSYLVHTKIHATKNVPNAYMTVYVFDESKNPEETILGTLMGFTQFQSNTVLFNQKYLQRGLGVNGITHEFGHALGMLSDVNGSDAWTDYFKWDNHVTNCAILPSVAFSYNNKVYGNTTERGCSGSSLMYASSPHGIMSYKDMSTNYDPVECGSVLKALEGGSSQKPYYPECAKLLNSFIK